MKSKALSILFCVVEQVESNFDIAVAKSVNAGNEAANDKVVWDFWIRFYFFFLVEVLTKKIINILFVQ